MVKRTVTVDFSHRDGRVKAMNGILGGAKCGPLLEYDFSHELRTGRVPIVRTRGAFFPYGLNQYLDIHCIFPNMANEPDDESAYNFSPTDEYLRSIRDTGAEIFLCLGESQDTYPNKRYLCPNSDYCKIARICTNIVAHYNEGWASGFKLGIKYCEIYPGADSSCGFGGSIDEYFSLYSTVAKMLKGRFPKIKVGAYTSGGFRSLNHFDATPEEHGHVEYLEGFLYRVSRSEDTPLDFLSWRCETDRPEELSIHSNYARSYLNQFGLKKTQSIVSEFSINSKGGALSRELPALLASAYVIGQKSGIDMMMYDNAHLLSKTNPFFTAVGNEKIRHASFGVLSAFGLILSQKYTCEVSSDIRGELYSLASFNGSDGAVLVVTREYTGGIEIELKNSGFSTYSIKGILGGGEYGVGFSTELKDVPLENGKIPINAGKCEVYLITLK